MIFSCDKFERNQIITSDDKMGIKYPPGILKVFGAALKLSFLLSLIVATDIPKEINREAAVETITSCLNPPETARIKPKLT